MESNDVSELLQALRQETEPDSRVLWRLVRMTRTNVHGISVLNEALCLAVEQGFWSSVLLLLKAGASPNTRMEWNEATPLHICSANEQGTEMVQELLKRGADVNAEDDEKRTPLHYATNTRCVENMQELLKNGAMVDAVDDDGKTPLNKLIRLFPHYSAVQVLLSAGADVNFRDDSGWTILHHAIRFPLAPIVRLLLRYNADANIKSDDGDTPLHRAVFQPKSQELMRELLKGGARLNELNNNGHSSLWCAVHYLDEEATQELLRWGAAFEIVECLEALVVSASGASDEIAKELIRYVFIKDPYNLKSIRQQLMQERVINLLRNHSSPGCNLEDFKHACLSEVDALSKRSCDCGKSSIWGSINNSEECRCDVHQAILKFLFSGRLSNFTGAFFYKLSKEFLLEVSLNLMSYFIFKESEKRLILPWPCMKGIKPYVSFEDVVSFVQSKRSKMDASEFEKFLAFIGGESLVKSAPLSSEISPSIPKRLRVS